MQLVTIVQIVFAAAAVLAVLSLVAAVFDRVSHGVLIGVAVLLGLTAGVAAVDVRQAEHRRRGVAVQSLGHEGVGVGVVALRPELPLSLSGQE